MKKFTLIITGIIFICSSYQLSGQDMQYLYLPEGTNDPIEKQYYDNKDFNSVTGTVTLVFGWFAQ